MKPQSNFEKLQWSVQIATTDEAVAKDWKANHLNVKPHKDIPNKWYVDLKRNATYTSRDGGTPKIENNTPVKVVDHNVNPIDATRLGNGSKGNVLVWQRPYEIKETNKKGISTSLTGVQIIKFVVYGGAVGFEPVESEGTVAADGEDFAPTGLESDESVEGTADGENSTSTGVESDEPKKVTNKKKRGGDPPSAEDLVKNWK